MYFLFLVFLFNALIEGIKINTGFKGHALTGNNLILKRNSVGNRLCMFPNRFSIFFWKKKYHERPIDEKLSVIPVYIITNNNNSPYIFNEQDRQICYMFLCPYDAENMLNEIIKSNGMQNRNNIKLYNINMQKAYELIKEFMHLKKLENQNSDVKNNIVYWKLIPSKRQTQNAYVFLSYRKKSELVFPVFYVDGFYVNKDRANIVPLFFDIEDLRDTLNKKGVKNYKIKVLNFVDLIFSENHKSFGFVPSSKSLEYLDKLNKLGTRRSYF
ncbi:apicoplast TIC22 protein, putative [Plasmodium chabaudi chabaudi]|uniref:Apicoplast TIC22 protein, putative n=1 Tax=Plasmodium chabaudi chabaudi TaxID=31271 RepID=A0A1D3S217_PLACU|nr:apicoplast TIC22 protein, putative [Plasmodium chabaudi chabaudi]